MQFKLNKRNIHVKDVYFLYFSRPVCLVYERARAKRHFLVDKGYPMNKELVNFYWSIFCCSFALSLGAMSCVYLCFVCPALHYIDIIFRDKHTLGTCSARRNALFIGIRGDIFSIISLFDCTFLLTMINDLGPIS